MAKSKSDTASQDVFARIAADGNMLSSAPLIEPEPIKHARRILESRVSDPTAAFRPAVKIGDKAKLERELSRQRKRMARFQVDQAPKLKNTRTVLPLETFAYRLETPQDLQDSQHAFKGRGQWEQVKIPHYGGPLGRATSYYRTTFELSQTQINGKACCVHFKGVDYKAHVFVNGTFLGSHEGFFAPFEVDFTRVARPGQNVLVVRVENDAICMSNNSWDQDREGDKIYAATGLGYDDPEQGWHHCPPGMGIYGDVFVEIKNPVHIADIFVRPLLAQEKAEVWIELHSTHLTKEKVPIEFSIFGQNFKAASVPNQRYEVTVGPTRNYYRYEVPLKNPKIWDLETPWLYQVQVQVRNEKGRLLDAAKQQFGMRSFQLETDSDPKGMFRLNGRRIKLRGANEMGYVQQCVMKKTWNKLHDAILLAKICHMNFLRLTQRPVQKEVYEACDRLGLMTQTDLPLFSVFRPNQFAEGVRQAEEMERLVRSHPCNILVTYINEPFPADWTWVFNSSRHLSREDLNKFFTACDQAVRLANPDRVIKPVDGDYDPPHEGLPDNHCYNLWYIGSSGLPVGKLIKGYWQKVKPGWNYGCGEFGAEGLDPLETMYKYYPRQWLPKQRKDLWSPGTIVKSQTQRFHYVWFPTQTTIDHWVNRSQQFQAWATQTMTEAFRRDPRMVSFAIHLFIDAFPAGWMKAIMDVDANPKPAFFAYREALTPVAVNIRTDRQTYFGGERLEMEFWVCNDLDQRLENLEIRYQVRDGKKIVFANKSRLTVKPLTPELAGLFQYPLPNVTARKSLQVELAVRDAQGKLMHHTTRSVEVFPRRPAELEIVHILGEKKGPAWRLAQELGLPVKKWTTRSQGLIMTDSFELLMRYRSALESSVRQGSRLVLTDPIDKIDELMFADLKAQIHPAGMGPAYFANPNTGHPLMQDFKEQDFFLWHSAETNMIEPLLSMSMTTSGMDPLLLTGNGTWLNKQWQSEQAASVAQVGQGEVCLSLITLQGRTKTNPSARKYALHILGL